MPQALVAENKVVHLEESNKQQLRRFPLVTAIPNGKLLLRLHLDREDLRLVKD